MAAKRPSPRPASPVALRRGKQPADVRRIMAKLHTQHPGADTELHYTNAYELLAATILSAQSTDERVNQVTPALFKRYPDARTLAKATTAELEPQIHSTGFFRAKSKSLIGMATAVVERHGGQIPKTMAELVELPGVGRKTANVVLGHALGVPGLPVDRHVLRVSNRIGIVRSEDAEAVEQQLTSALPESEWTLASDTLILHGRRICKPRPQCEQCVVRDDCDYYQGLTRIHEVATKERQREKVAKPRDPEQNRHERGQAMPVRRAAKPGAAGLAGGSSEQNRHERGQAMPVRRAAKPRGAGFGGGAPKQTKK